MQQINITFANKCTLMVNTSRKKNILYTFIKWLTLLAENTQKNILRIRYKIISSFIGIDITLDPLYNASLINKEYVDYQHSYTYYVKRIMNCFEITTGDNIFDYGSGKGGILIFFSKYNFGRIEGVELIPELNEIARKNIDKRKLKNLKTHNMDATKYEDIDSYNYFYFYNPFTGDTLKSVVEQIRQSLIRQKRKVTIIYQNPQGRELFIKSGIFPYVKCCFVPSLINRNKNNTRYGRQFIDIYCTEYLDIDFEK
jgi:hypothetical protein